MSKPEYYLSKDTYFCIVDDNFVFLDLSTDKYLSVDLTYTNLICSMIGISPEKGSRNLTKTSSQTSIPIKEIESFGKVLTDKKLLTRTLANGKQSDPIDHISPTVDFNGFDLNKKVDIGFFHFFKLFKSIIKITIQMKFYSLKYVAKKVKTRKRQFLIRQRSIKSTGEKDLEGLSNLVETFKTLRPFFYTAKNHCLYDSLVLADFLARYKIRTQTVLAVSVTPFCAHCWVQFQDLVLNDEISNVTQYEAILIL